MRENESNSNQERNKMKMKKDEKIVCFECGVSVSVGKAKKELIKINGRFACPCGGAMSLENQEPINANEKRKE